jgi:putative ABC transport system permease protein
MNLISHYIVHPIKSALDDFRRNKIRTALTSLGIAIGVFSVVLLVALGLGLKNYLSQQFERLGANLIIIFPGNISGGDEGGISGFGSGFAGGTHFDEDDYKNLTQLREADFVVPQFLKRVIVESGGQDAFGYVMGTNEQIFKVLDINIIKGEAFTKSDIQVRSRNTVLGYSLAEKLFEFPEDGINRTIRVAGQRFRVVGIAEKTGNRQQDNAVFVPYTTTFGTLNPEKNFFAIILGTTDRNNVRLMKEKAEELLGKKYKEGDFTATEQAEIMSAVSQIFNIVSAVLVAIGSVSLIVGGVGIMNIMYATVTERTKEIGIRRAVGATETDILKQFLTESVLLSLFGGIVGFLTAVVAVSIIKQFLPATISLFTAVIAFTVSSAIGIFFGVFPAMRAAKLSPIEAIRYE